MADKFSPEQRKEIEELAREMQAEGPDEFPTGYYIHLAEERMSEAHTVKLARQVARAHEELHAARSRSRRAQDAARAAVDEADRAESAAGEARANLIAWLS